jgi:hypothetical protein
MLNDMAPDSAITQWLTMLRDTCRGHGPFNGYTYAGIGDFLLQHGVWYEPRSLPARVRRGLPRRCFHNALRLAKTRGYRYIEGYAVADIGVLFPAYHAWNLDRDGKLVDNTWDEVGLAYFGVEFPLDVAKKALRYGDGSVLDNPKSRFAIFKVPWMRV